MNQAPHALDLFLWIGGMPRAVQGLAATRLHAIAVEDVALALCDYGQGNVGWLYATLLVNSHRLDRIGREVAAAVGMPVFGRVRLTIGRQARDAYDIGLHSCGLGGCSISSCPSAIWPAATSASASKR
jgi:predicted dehydrogenase